MFNYLSIIMPTRGYSSYLVKSLNALSSQTTLPNEVIIVSAKKINSKFIYKKKLNIKIVYSKKANQVVQRNIGLRNLSKKANIILQLDDRIVLYKDCINELFYSWKIAKKNVVGIGINIINKNKSFGLLNQISNTIGINGKIPFIGLNIDNINLKNDQEVSWLNGGLSSWNLKKNLRIYDRKFPEWTWCVFEDVDYSLGKIKKDKLFICSKAKANILESRKLNFNDNFKRGVLNTLAIKMLISKYSNNPFFVYLANFFLIFFSILKSIISLDLLNFYFSLGRLFGFCKKNIN